MIASDFRRIARDSLSGNWLIAVITGLIATILTGELRKSSGGFEINLGDFNIHSFEEFSYQFEEIISTPYFLSLLAGILSTTFMAGIIWWLVGLVLGGVIDIGYARFNIDLVNGSNASLESLFSYVSRFKTGFCMRLLAWLYTTLWSLLFVIPGIIATYRYAMAPYILAENPNLTAREAIAASKELMHGNKFRLFCLHLSFIGWQILSAFTFGIGQLWLRPYIAAAEASFYRDIVGPTTQWTNREEAGSTDEWDYSNMWTRGS